MGREVEPRRSTDPPPPVDVMGLPIRPLATEGLIDLLAERARAALRTTVCYANAHTVNLAWRDREFRRLLCRCDVLYADGASVVWASRWSRKRLQERMTAADTFPKFAQRCAAGGLSLYLLGSRPGVSQKAAAHLRERAAGLKIVGARDGYFRTEESQDVVDDINAAAPDVLVVGMSSPRQERWLEEWGEQLKPPVRWCVGALFDYLGGVEPRAPAWLCRMSGEWLFRFLADPVGKWRRYLIGNPLFVWNALRWRVGVVPQGLTAEAPP